MTNIYSGQTLGVEPKIYEFVKDEQTMFYSSSGILLRPKEMNC